MMLPFMTFMLSTQERLGVTNIFNRTVCAQLQRAARSAHTCACTELHAVRVPTRHGMPLAAALSASASYTLNLARSRVVLRVAAMLHSTVACCVEVPLPCSARMGSTLST
jgi:hypothetical protein